MRMMRMRDRRGGGSKINCAAGSMQIINSTYHIHPRHLALEQGEDDGMEHCQDTHHLETGPIFQGAMQGAWLAGEGLRTPGPLGLLAKVGGHDSLPLLLLVVVVVLLLLRL